MFKCALIGSHCVGKTTVAQPLADALGVNHITEVVRAWCARKGIAHVSQIPDPVVAQWSFLLEQMHSEVNSRPLGFVSDRSTVDNAAYAKLYAFPKMSERDKTRYLDFARQNAESYTHLIYFPVAWDDVQEDGFRDTDRWGRQLVDDLINALLRDWGLEHKVYRVTSDGPENRLAEILGHMGVRAAA